MTEKAKRVYIEEPCKQIIHEVSGYKLAWCLYPHRLTVTTYKGCHHGCPYCYAIYTKADFFTTVHVKVNAPEVFEKQLRRRIERNLPKDPICLGSVSDPYQPVEGKYKLTRQILQICDELDYPVFIVTKGSMIIRDIDVLSSLAKRDLVMVNVTLTTMNESLRAKMEAMSPPTMTRLRIMEQLTNNGIRCSVYLLPVFPYLTDKIEDLGDLLARAATIGAEACSSTFLKLSPVVWKHFRHYLAKQDPSLVPLYYILRTILQTW